MHAISAAPTTNGLLPASRRRVAADVVDITIRRRADSPAQRRRHVGKLLLFVRCGSASWRPGASMYRHPDARIRAGKRARKLCVWRPNLASRLQQHELPREDDHAGEVAGLRRVRTVRGATTAIGVLAALIAAPYALLLVLGASLQRSEGASAPGAIAIAIVGLAGFGCFVASVVTSRSGPLKRSLALLAGGALLVGGSAALLTAV